MGCANCVRQEECSWRGLASRLSRAESAIDVSPDCAAGAALGKTGPKCGKGCGQTCFPYTLSNQCACVCGERMGSCECPGELLRETEERDGGRQQ